MRLENGPVPISAVVTSYFGSQEFGLRSDPHRGMDFSVPVGTSVFAPADGVVVSASSDNGGGGNIIVLDHPQVTTLTGTPIKTVYLHLSAFKARAGDHVSAGQVIALSGNTGHSTGPHLHFEVRLTGTRDNAGGELRDDPVDWLPSSIEYPVKDGLNRPPMSQRAAAMTGPNRWVTAAGVLFVVGVAYLFFV
jgi:murein DD-endopeptidase MepM/ murein hydrolase activator NlpD